MQPDSPGRTAATRVKAKYAGYNDDNAAQPARFSSCHMSRFSPFSRPDAAAAAALRPSGAPGSSGTAARPGKSRKFGPPRAPQPLTEVLSRTDAFAPLRAGVEQIAAIQRDLDALLPDYLAASVEPGFIKDGKLALFAAHNALAARLRHLEPRLVADLQARGWSLDGVRIRVRPQAVKEPPLPKQARMTPAGAAALAALSENLPPSPLQEALAKMAARHLKRR